MRVKDLGEFGLIDRISKMLPSPRSDVLVGIGDDVAVLQSTGEECLLATCDSQVENVHFLRNRITPCQLGRKTAAINISDIAAMGGEPLWALVSLALPPETDVGFVDGLYEGMRDQLRLAGASIVGGNISRISKDVVIDFCLLGRGNPSKLILRSGAREGDVIMVTGSLGDSRAGLELILNPDTGVPDDVRRFLEERHLAPQPRLEEGRTLARWGKVTAMADVSDGLAGDIGHICDASGAGAEIRMADLPVSSACKEAALAAGKDAWDWALSGGEDYELLFTVSPDSVEEVRELLRSETGTLCTAVGRIVSREEGVRVIRPDGRSVSAVSGSGGWDHFSGS